MLLVVSVKRADGKSQGCCKVFPPFTGESSEGAAKRRSKGAFELEADGFRRDRQTPPGCVVKESQHVGNAPHAQRRVIFSKRAVAASAEAILNLPGFANQAEKALRSCG